MGDPTGEAGRGALRLDFDRRLILQFRGSTITSDAGVLPYRELADTPGLTDTGGDMLADARAGKNGRHRLVGLLRQSVFGRLAGYEDLNDADRLCHDPAMRWVVGDRAITESAASASQMGRFETKWLSRPENLAALADLPGRWIDRVHTRVHRGWSCSTWIRARARRMASRKAPLTTATSVVPVITGCSCSISLAMSSGAPYGQATCIAPTRCWSRWSPATGAPWCVSNFPGDAAFANPEIYEFLEGEGIGYPIRLPANRVLQERIGNLKRSVGRPPLEVRRYYARFTYQAQSWKKSRRVVARVEWHPGELYPRVGFIVTNLARPAERVVAFYNQRGTAENWIKEGKGAIKWTRLSCRTLAANAVRLQWHALAYNLGNFMRPLAMPKAVEPWSLTSLREKLIKIGAKVVSHGRYVTFQMAEVAVSQLMFKDILMLIARLRASPAPA